MYPFVKNLKDPVKWLFLTALIATLGFTLNSLFPQHTSYSDDAIRLLVTEMQKVNSDGESQPQSDDISGILIVTKQFQFGSNLNPHHLFFSEFSPRIAFLHHIRPRSPPQS